MKKNRLLFVPVLLLFLLTGSDVPYPGSSYTPIFMMRSEMESAIEMTAPQMLENPGKIYFKDDFIFINEKYRGIHVVDNFDPGNPLKTGFIHIDGCIDIAMKENVLYADNAVDLIALKLTDNFSKLEVSERIRNVFPELRPPDGWYIDWRIEQMRPENSVIVRWDKNTENK